MPRVRIISPEEHIKYPQWVLPQTVQMGSIKVRPLPKIKHNVLQHGEGYPNYADPGSEWTDQRVIYSWNLEQLHLDEDQLGFWIDENTKLEDTLLRTHLKLTAKATFQDVMDALGKQSIVILDRQAQPMNDNVLSIAESIHNAIGEIGVVKINQSFANVNPAVSEYVGYGEWDAVASAIDDEPYEWAGKQKIATWMLANMNWSPAAERSFITYFGL